MTILLTGITGNLGFELASSFLVRGANVVPIIRPGKASELTINGHTFHEAIESDLLDTADIVYSGPADVIVHSAGRVHFTATTDENERMLDKIIRLAISLNVPIVLVSTAYVYRPYSGPFTFHSNYEKDKWQAEQRLIDSGRPHSIFRPSILVGHHASGMMQNWSGYYLVVRALLDAATQARKQRQHVRFPTVSGKTNLVTVDQAAESIASKVLQQQHGLYYVTNPEPPTHTQVIDDTIELTGTNDVIKRIDCDFAQFGQLNLSDIESKLHRYVAHFNPYWALSYPFPESLCQDNFIHRAYLATTLESFRTSQQSQ